MASLSDQLRLFLLTPLRLSSTPNPFHRSRISSFTSWFSVDGLLDCLDSGLRIVGPIGTILCAGVILFVTGGYLCKLLPFIVTHWSQLPATIHTITALFIIANVGINYVLCMSRSAGRVVFEDESTTLEMERGKQDGWADDDDLGIGWRWCNKCNQAKPPRAHHCSVCGVCYLRLCHHCVILRCIGFGNYVYFFRFIFWTWLGAIFGAVTCCKLLPIVVWHKYPSLHELVFAVLVVTVGGSVALSCLLGFHIYLVSSGQTTIEFYQNNAARQRSKTFENPYNLGIKRNFEHIFGPPKARWMPWWIAFAVTSTSRPVGDGMTYATKLDLD